MSDTLTRPRPDAHLQIKSLLHPADFSRMLVALAAVAISVGAYLVFLVSVAGVIGLIIVSAILATVVGSVWFALQLYRARLLGQSVRVSEDSLPQIQALVDDIRSRLAYHRPVDVYITQKSNPSVSLTSYFGTKVIVLEGSLIGDLIEGEERAQLTFLLARSFGALKARHHRFAFAIVLLDALRLLPYVAPFLLPYFRTTTYSGDQIGVACCDSLPTALAATERLLVGKEVEPSLRLRGVIAQAEVVRRRWLPRLVQLLLGEPHLTNRYVNLVLFSQRSDPAAYESFRESIDEPTLARLDVLARRSAYRRRPSNAARRAAGAALTTIIVLAMLGGVTAMALSLRDAAGPAHASSTDDASGREAAIDPVAAEPSGATSAQEELLSHVPAPIRSSCASNDTSSATGAVASVRCDGGGIFYDLFATASDLDSDFEISRSLSDASTDGDCESGDYDGTWSLTSGGAEGRLLCFVDDGTAWIQWTHDELLIGARMLSTDADSAALHAAWLAAGPQ